MASDRSTELAPAWLASVLVRWDRTGAAHVLVGPSAGPLPAPGPIHVVTSQDPAAVAQTEERNLELLADLLAWAGDALPVERWWWVAGTDVASHHTELGIGVAGWTRAEAVAAGARWEQLAIYELTDDDVLVIPSDGSGTEPIGTTRRRWPESSPEAALDPTDLDRWWRTYLTAGLDQSGGGTLET